MSWWDDKSGWSSKDAESWWAGACEADDGWEDEQAWQHQAARWSETPQRPAGSGYRPRGSDPEGWKHGGLELRPSHEELDMFLRYGIDRPMPKKLKLQDKHTASKKTNAWPVSKGKLP